MRRLLGFLIYLFFFGLSAYGYEVQDATHAKVNIPKPPQRIITLAPSLGELAAEVLGGNTQRIIGVSEYTDFPIALQKKASVGPYHKFNIEKVVSLKPDLVLATLDGNTKGQIEHLRELKIPVMVVRTEDFDQVTESMKLVAKSLGEDAKGDALADRFTRGLEEIRARKKGRQSVSVLLQVGDKPLVIAGGKSFLTAALQVLGAQNIYSETQVHYPRPSLEDVIRRNPDVMILLALGGDIQAFQEAAKAWQRFPELKAVKNQRIHVVQNDALVRPTLRMLEGLAILETTLYGKK